MIQVKHFFFTVIPSLVFNLRYLPFRQACLIPIYVNRVKVNAFCGKIVFDPEIKMTRGMVKIGFPITGIQPSRPYVIDLHGTVSFHGSCQLGGGGYLSVGEHGALDIADGVVVNDLSKIICFHKIVFGKNMAAGWECTFMDTDFHAMKNVLTRAKSKAYAPIIIGDNCWFASNCIILKGTKIPTYTTVSAGSVLSGAYDCCDKTILRGNPAQPILPGFLYRDREDDKVEYD